MTRGLSGQGMHSTSGMTLSTWSWPPTPHPLYRLFWLKSGESPAPVLSKVKAQSRSECRAAGSHGCSLHSTLLLSSHSARPLLVPSLSWPKSDMPTEAWPSVPQNCDWLDTPDQITSSPGRLQTQPTAPPSHVAAMSAPHSQGERGCHTGLFLVPFIEVRWLWKEEHPFHPGRT